MIKEIITDEDILSKPCEPATAEDASIGTDLVETLLASDEAVWPPTRSARRSASSPT